MRFWAGFDRVSPFALLRIAAPKQFLFTYPELEGFGFRV